MTKDAGVVAGDLILWWASSGYPYDHITCPGFTAVAPYSGGNITGQLLYRKADGTEGSTFTVTTTYSTTFSVIQATIAGPCAIEVIGALNAPGSGSANPSATGLTVAGSNDLLLWFGAATGPTASTLNGTPVATTVPAGFTQRVTGMTGDPHPGMLLCDKGSVVAGATGSIAATNAAVDSWATQMVAIKVPTLAVNHGLLAFT
jgi:hypothetical protein